MSSSSSYNPQGVPTCQCCTLPAVDSSGNGSPTKCPVVIGAGWLMFEVPLLQSSAIGAGSFAIDLNYMNVDPSITSSDGVVGTGFNFSQNIVLKPSGNDVLFQKGNNTQQQFDFVRPGVYSSAVANNNTAATLTRTGEGTPEDQFTLTSRVGNVSHYFGFHPSIKTPGRLKSLTDRYGNLEFFNWQSLDGAARLMSVVDSYGRTTTFTYDGCGSGQLRQITDFWGRQVNFQYDGLGHLTAVVGPSITRGANNNSNSFPNGTAYVYQYDINNPRADRRNDLIKVWYPNQVAPYLNSSRIVDVTAVYASATPRQQISYYNDPTDSFQYGKIQQLIESATGNGAVGAGAYGFVYLNSALPGNVLNPSDPIIARTVTTDRNGNQAIYDSNARWMVVHEQTFATRGKNSLEASNWETWTSYNSHNQILIQVKPEGNSTVNTYEDETNTIQINGVPYAPRIGLLKSSTQFPGNAIGMAARTGSNGQSELSNLYFYDPLFNRQCAVIEPRGNPIDGEGTFFPPQNGGTTPTHRDRSRYATFTYFDYQKDDTHTVKSDATLQSQLSLTEHQIGQLIAYVDNQMNRDGTHGPLPAGFQMGIGDVNGENTGAETGNNAMHTGSVVETKYPSVRQLVPNTGEGDPWVWQTQDRLQLFTSNARGQQTTSTDPEGNLTVFTRYPEANPDGDFDVYDPALSNQQYGRIKQMIVDADPTTVMTLVGPEGDMSAFIGNKITRTNTPGVYQQLTTTYQGESTSPGCSTCNYDPLGNVLSQIDPRGNLTKFDRNELGEVYRTTSPAPYNFQVETSYDANRNMIQTDTQDQQVQYTGASVENGCPCNVLDPSDPNFGHFIPTGSGSTANVPMIPGPGGSGRPGWFSNLYSFDLLDEKIEDDIDATGSTPSSLVTTYAYDFNQNLITITKPMGNTVEYDYDERNIRIATRIGYDPENDQPGSITINAFDGNGNLLDGIGPMKRGTAANSLTVILDDAFGDSTALTHSGDWIMQNQYDGFDRLIQSTDAVGGIQKSTFDPNGRTIAAQQFGTAGGATPMDRSGSANVKLASNESFFDEAGRGYDSQQDVFLNTTGGNSVPSGRTITQTGGGLAPNSTTNNHTGTVTLTSGGTSYVLTRQVFDRAGRTILTASDNTAQTMYTFDGANRRLTVTDALGNIQQSTYDANGNVVSMTSIQICTISDSIPTESFGSLMFYDVLNRRVIAAQQGADGNLSSYFSPGSGPDASSTLFILTGYDSRGNATNSIDPKQNTAVTIYDGASRQIQNQQNLRTKGDGIQAIQSTVITQKYIDGDSRLIRLIDNNGGTTQYAYDTLDRRTIVIFHDGSTQSNVYDLASDVVTYTDENGSYFNNTFDCMGRKTAVKITPVANVIGTTSQSFQYDGRGRMIYAIDTGIYTANAGTIFDSLSRTLEEVQTAVTAGYVTYGNWTGVIATRLTYSNGRQVDIGYDVLYRKNSVTETTDSSNIVHWQFFGSRIATVTLGNGLVTSYMNNAQTRSAIQQGQTTPAWGDITTDHLGYDGAGRLIGKRHFDGSGVIVGNLSQYDKANNKLFERSLQVENRSNLYSSYDSMDRLLQYQRGILAFGGGSISTPITLPKTNQQQTYNLDGLGNWNSTIITPEGGTATIQNRVHNKLNQVNNFGGTPVLYDHGNNTGAAFPNRGNGNIADDGMRIYQYDALNRLAIVFRKSDSMQIGRYVYDAIGRRIQKIVSNGGLTGDVPNGLTNYIYMGQQCQEEGNDVVATRQYVWGHYIDDLVLMTTNINTGAQSLPSGDYYLLSDLLYRSQTLTDSSGTIQEAYDTDAYGNTLIFQSPGIDGSWWTDDAVISDQPAREVIFTGRQYDPEDQIYFYRARYYYSALGRFISGDPIGFGPSLNVYQYCGDMPCTNMDSSGMDDDDGNGRDRRRGRDRSGRRESSPPQPNNCPKKICGPDVTAQLGAVLALITSDFNTVYNPAQRTAVCDGLGSFYGLTHYDSVRNSLVYLNAWDTDALGGGSPHQWMSTQYSPCASGAECQITVMIAGTCGYTGSFNYAIYGVMSKLCGISQADMDSKIDWYKGPGYFKSASPNWQQSKDWADAGYNGWPAAGTPVPAQDPRYAQCETCNIPYKGIAFGYYWYGYSLAYNPWP